MREITLTRGLVTLVDANTFDVFSGLRWYAHTPGGNRFYAARRQYIGGDRRRGLLIYLHRAIMSPSEGLQVDHINGNTLDNRRANLRVCTQSENLRNSGKMSGARTSRYKGVSYDIGAKSWRAFIRAGGRVRALGCFRTEIDAAKAYDLAALSEFGQYARLNFPLGVA